MQPPLTLVPIPTNNPEKITNGKEFLIKNGISLLINILNINISFRYYKLSIIVCIKCLP